MLLCVYVGMCRDQRSVLMLVVMLQRSFVRREGLDDEEGGYPTAQIV